jgi:hypothetical protein
MKKYLSLLILSFLAIACKEDAVLEANRDHIDFINQNSLYSFNLSSRNWNVYKSFHGLDTSNIDIETTFDFNQDGNFNLSQWMGDCNYLAEDDRYVIYKPIIDYSVSYRKIDSIGAIQSDDSNKLHAFRIYIKNAYSKSIVNNENPFGDIPFLTACDQEVDITKGHEIVEFDGVDLSYNLASTEREQLEEFHYHFVELTK